MTTDDFKLTKFFELPWPILRQICLYLKFDQLIELMDALQLQEMILDLLCHENLFISTATRQVEVLWNGQYVAINKTSIADCFKTHPDINPRTYCVIVQGGFVHDMTTCLHQRLNRAEDIAISSLDEPAKIATGHDLRLLFSYPGIQTIHLNRRIMRKHDVELAYWIPQITGLKTLSLEVENRTQLPFLSRLEHLECLEISTEQFFTYVENGFQTVSTHKMLRKVFSQDSFLSSFTSIHLKFPPLLKSLQLYELCLTNVEVSYLPPTLETLDLFSNKIDTFEHETHTPQWPINLKNIDLLHNNINESSLEQLLCIKWPPLLQTLSLGGNDLTSLEDLINLPDSITDLQLCGDWKSLPVSHNPDGYPLFKLPKSLRTFCLENRESFLEDDSGDDSDGDSDDDEEFQGRIKFPPNLEYLTLIRASRNDCLRHWIFPPTLKTLHLEDDGIQDLNSYSSVPGDVEEVNWAQLANLRELKLNRNEIFTLCHWCPPRLLRSLNLAANKITALKSEMTPLFNEKFREMTQNLLQIHLGFNLIETIDNDVYLPENLCELDMSLNRFSQFVFTESFASHRNLFKLDLQHNDISKLFVHNRVKRYASQLQELHLFDRTYSSPPDECNDVFEQLGLIPKRLPWESWRHVEIYDETWKAERRLRTFYFEH